MLRPWPHLLLAFAITVPAQARQPAQTPGLAELVHQLPSAASQTDPAALMALAEALSRASLADLQANLPDLIALSENPEPRVRSAAILSITSLTWRERGAVPTDNHTVEAGVNLLVPFIPRLTPCLADPDPPARRVCLLLMSNLAAFIRPTPPPLLDALLKVLEDPGSTTPVLASPPLPGRPQEPGLIMGPTTVYALLPANATLEVDPITHKPHAQSAPDVQAAVLRFLHRPDQTSQSLAETIHNIALARLTNPEFNADLLRFLDYPDETVRFALVTDLNRFTFPPSAVPAIKSRLALLASDPSASPELRAEAARILPCWNDDRACVLLPRGQAPSR